MSEAGLRYEEAKLYTVDELRRIASSGDANAVMRAVVGVALNPENELEAMQEIIDCAKHLNQTFGSGFRPPNHG